MPTTHTLALADADIVYDVRGPLPPADGRPPLLMIAQPMPAAGFATLASHFADRTVVTYDPRGLGRSTRKVGEESRHTFTGRAAVATAELLGQPVTVLPSHHGGILGGEFGYAGQPEAFARKLREVLDGQRADR
jgi:hypothetical protein